MEQRSQQVVAVTPADQLLARLGVDLAEHAGEDVDPRMLRLAEADLTPPDRSDTQIPEAHGPTTVWLDDETGVPVAYSPSSRRTTSADELARVREWARDNGYQISEKGRDPAPSSASQTFK